MTEPRLLALAELGSRLGAATMLEDVVDTALVGVDELLGHRHVLLLVHDVATDVLVTLASRGYDTVGIGSEVLLGEGVIGSAGASRRTMRIGNLQRMLRYAQTVQRTSHAGVPGTEIRLPGLAGARSQLAAPMIAFGTLVGVLAVESELALAFDEDDELALSVAANLVGHALEREQATAGDAEAAVAPALVSRPAPVATGAARLRHYAVDGSTFIDDTYLIKGVAGRLRWKVVSEHHAGGRTTFTNREARLDPSLELPGFRDNFESRLVLLMRRLEERDAPIRIVRRGRGRFALDLRAPIELERIEAAVGS
jgi:adenylate cyclase